MAPTRPAEQPVRAALAAAMATLLLYLLSTSYVAADGDGVLETGLLFAEGAGLRSYHLLQTPLNRAAYGLWTACGWRGPSFVPLHILNVCLGALAAGLLLLICRRIGLGVVARWVATATFVLSATPWFHSRTAETAMTPLPLVLAALLLLLPEEPPHARAAECRVAAAAALTAGAALLSLNFILWVVVMPFALPLLAPEKRRWPRLVAIGLATLLLVGLGPYLWVALFDRQTAPAGFWHWFSYHTDAKGLAGTGGGVVGVMRAVVGIGRLVFPASAGETAVKAILRHREVAVGPAAWLSLARNLAATGGLLVLLARGWSRTRRAPETRLLAAVLATTAVFNIVWLGSDPQFWLPVYPVMLAFAAHGASDLGPVRLRRTMAATGLLLLFAVNVQSTTPTPLSPSWGPLWRPAQRAAEVLPRGSLVIVPGNASLRLLPAFRDDVEVLDLTYSAPQELEGKMFLDWVGEQIDAALARGSAVYVEGLREPLPAELLGWWEMAGGTHRVTRAGVEEWLAAAYRLTPAPEVGEHVTAIAPAALTDSP